MKALGSIPPEELARVVARYKADVALESMPRLRKHQAVRALKRVEAACEAVLRTLDELPEELQTLSSGDLRAAASEIRHEAAFRLFNTGRFLDQRKDMTPRARLEASVAYLYSQYGGKLSTYDPAQYQEPGDGPGKRGGGLANALRAVYGMAAIDGPLDLGPVLERLVAQSEHH